jgi:Ohr subfamily peroxiredoxin
MKVLYTASATASGGREGRVRSSDSMLDLELSMPKELGSSGRAATNPEQLFAAGYAACFENALLRAGREAKTPIIGSEVTASVGIGRKQDTRFALTVALSVKIPNLDREQATKLMNQAREEICPYSNATRGNIEVSVTLA